MVKKDYVIVVGGGLAGSEAAWQLAKRGIKVLLYEMRPKKTTPAHKTPYLAELVCSNSLGADLITSPAGILKRELRLLDSIILKCADKNRVPAGKALAVDRTAFSLCVTESILKNPDIRVVREELTEIPKDRFCIIATGPLTSDGMMNALKEVVGDRFLYFYDAISPVVVKDSIDFNRAFWGSRYNEGCDYINCPLTKQEYDLFVKELVNAETHKPHDFERGLYFEGCLPVEVIAKRGKDALRYGPMKPVGLIDPRTGKEPYAVVQLRQDNKEGTLFNIVGFQTSLRWSEQDRVFRLIPALKDAEFARYGVIHKNTYINAPELLNEFLALKCMPNIFIAGQLTGVEGYLESTAMGIVAALNVWAILNGKRGFVFPKETAIGVLTAYLREALSKSFKPMNLNLGLFPKLAGKKIKDRRKRCLAYAERAFKVMIDYIKEQGI